MALFKNPLRWLCLPIFSVILTAGTGFNYSIETSPHFKGEKGKIFFRSDAPLELIEAESEALKGIINTEKGTFAFTVPISTFQGFNSPLQQEHFNENYLESDRYPNATFVGRIIEKVDFSANGSFSIRAKGQLNIHGIEQERIIKSEMTIKDETIEIRSKFTVPLADHNITIPKIVHQKIAEEIYVEINLELTSSSA